MQRQPTGEPFVIRPPTTAAETRACRMPLQRATGAGRRAQWHVAVSGPDQLVVSAAARGIELAPDATRRWVVHVRVIVPARGSGVARALMRRVVEQVDANGTTE